jgi:hypothetical protein
MLTYMNAHATGSCSDSSRAAHTHRQRDSPHRHFELLGVNGPRAISVKEIEGLSAMAHTNNIVKVQLCSALQL